MLVFYVTDGVFNRLRRSDLFDFYMEITIFKLRLRFMSRSNKLLDMLLGKSPEQSSQTASFLYQAEIILLKLPPRSKSLPVLWMDIRQWVPFMREALLKRPFCGKEADEAALPV